MRAERPCLTSGHAGRTKCVAYGRNVIAAELADGWHRRVPGPAHHRNDHRVRRAVGESALFNRENA
jgi:hypothetical protein